MDRKGAFIGAYRGRKFWPLDPRVEDVDMVGVAHALSQICRFNGHTNKFWSIAQHSILVAEILKSYMGYADDYRIRLLGLLHDASEAYISDLLRPFKQEVNGYKEIEANVEKVILECCGIFNANETEWGIVKRADNYALALEATELVEADEEWNVLNFWEDGLTEFKKYVKVESMKHVETKFLIQAKSLMHNLELERLL